MPFHELPPIPPPPDTAMVGSDGKPAAAWVEWFKALNNYLKRLAKAVP